MTIKRAVGDAARRLYLVDTDCATNTEAAAPGDGLAVSRRSRGDEPRARQRRVRAVVRHSFCRPRSRPSSRRCGRSHFDATGRRGGGRGAGGRGRAPAGRGAAPTPDEPGGRRRMRRTRRRHGHGRSRRRRRARAPAAAARRRIRARTGSASRSRARGATRRSRRRCPPSDAARRCVQAPRRHPRRRAANANSSTAAAFDAPWVGALAVVVSRRRTERADDPPRDRSHGLSARWSCSTASASGQTRAQQRPRGVSREAAGRDAAGPHERQGSVARRDAALVSRPSAGRAERRAAICGKRTFRPPDDYQHTLAFYGCYRLALVGELDVDARAACSRAIRDLPSPDLIRQKLGRHLGASNHRRRARVSQDRRRVRAAVRLRLDPQALSRARRLEGSRRREVGDEHRAALDVGVDRDGDVPHRPAAAESRRRASEQRVRDVPDARRRRA